MTRVFVSGCYDILHAGHLQFFQEARALGDHLTVCFASADVLWLHKRRKSSLPDEHKAALLRAVDVVDEVVVGTGTELGFDFKEAFLSGKPDILAVTVDDQYTDAKKALCEQVGAKYVVLPKTPPRFAPISTSEIVRFVRAPDEAPLRVDFAGGWLDVPKFARDGGYVVNCAISPLVSLRDWPYERNAGLGGSGAWALLNGRDGVRSELDLGVGWQDPAVIAEGGLCVWRSGERPSLEIKTDAGMLRGRLALFWTGNDHSTPDLAARQWNLDPIFEASLVAREAVWRNDFERLVQSVRMSWDLQLAEGMEPLPADLAGVRAWKYCGGGFGGYAVYLFADQASRDAACTGERFRPVEPYNRPA